MASIPQSDYVEIQYGDRPVDPLASAIKVMERRLDQHIGQGGSQHAAATEQMAGFMSAVDKQKMEGIQAGATRNSPDEFLLNRGNHTGLQAIETVEGLRQQLDDALAGGSNFRGLFPSLEALQQEIPVAAPGNYADVDEGQDINAVRYIWDESDQEWVSAGEGEPLTAPQVKTLLLANPNTNTLTDSEYQSLLVLQSIVNVRAFPFLVKGDNTSEDRDRLVQALDYCAENRIPAVVPPGLYEFNDWIPLPDKIKLVFLPGAVWSLTQNTSLGGFVCGGYDIELNKRPFTEADIYGIELDTNNLPGENSFNAINAVGVRVFNPKLRNIKLGVVTQGGKAFQFEGDVVDGISIYSPIIENASIGINSHADPRSGAEIARNISYFDVVMRNVDVPFNCDGQFSDPEAGTLANMNTTVYGANLFNCGRLTYDQTADPLGGGIICGDRGMGLNVSGVRVFNEDGYGAIGALVRGTLFDVRVKDFVFNGPEVRNLVDFSPVTYGVSSQGLFACRVDIEAQAICKIGKIVNGYLSGKVGICNFEFLIDSGISELSSICDSESASGGLGMLNIYLRNADRQSTGLQLISSIFSNGNSLSLCQPQNIQGPFSVADGSGEGLQIISVDGYFERQYRKTSLTFRVDYPVNNSILPAKISGIPFTAYRNAGAVFPYRAGVPIDSGLVRSGSSVIELFGSNGLAITNADLSGLSFYVTLDYLAV